MGIPLSPMLMLGVRLPSGTGLSLFVFNSRLTILNEVDLLLAGSRLEVGEIEPRRVIAPTRGSGSRTFGIDLEAVPAKSSLMLSRTPLIPVYETE